MAAAGSGSPAFLFSSGGESDAGDIVKAIERLDRTRPLCVHAPDLPAEHEILGLPFPFKVAPMPPGVLGIVFNENLETGQVSAVMIKE